MDIKTKARRGSFDTSRLTPRQLTAYLSPCWRASDVIDSRFRAVAMGVSTILTINK